MIPVRLQGSKCTANIIVVFTVLINVQDAQRFITRYTIYIFTVVYLANKIYFLLNIIKYYIKTIYLIFILISPQLDTSVYKIYCTLLGKIQMYWYAH